MKRFALIPLLLATLMRLGAATTKNWEMNTYEDFLKGKFQGVSLTREGRLLLAPELTTVFSSDQPAIWSVARAPDGTLYLGTGHRGRVYRVKTSGESEVVWTADEPEVFAVAVDGKDTLWAATSPDGKVFRIKDGKASEFFDPGATYIWSLVRGRDGTLYVGTGGEGKIYRVGRDGKGELYYETGQLHVTALALDAAGRLLAGTEPNGILYRISAKGKAFVVYDANLPEVRALVPMRDGSLYAALLGGSVAKRAAAAQAAPAKTPRVRAPGTSITVSAAEGEIKIKPKPAKPKPAVPQLTTFPATAGIELTGVEKSAIFRISPDLGVDKLWSSTEENAYGLFVDGDRILFSTDNKGRVYELDSAHHVTLVTATNESEAVRLLRDGKKLLVATTNLGKIYRLGERPGTAGAYEAPVHDAAAPARWGKLSWRVEQTKGGQVTFETRSGNSALPDKTWSDWSAPLEDPEGSQILSPNARYIQWRAKFSGPGGRTPILDSVTLAYLPQNSAPKVTDITITNHSSPKPAASTTATRSTDTSAYSITVTDTGASGASTVTGTATQKLARTTSDTIRIEWKAEDADGDTLVYAVYFRGEEEKKWKLIKEDVTALRLSLDSETLADGKYLFRVTASDGRMNPPATARTAERVSAPVLIDHTPPVVRPGVPHRSGEQVKLSVEAEDAVSQLRRCEYSLDAGAWVPMAPEDGILDSKRERFTLQLEEISAGEHLLTVRVHDSAGNAGLAKVVLR